MDGTPESFKASFAEHNLRLLRQKHLQRENAIRAAERHRANGPMYELQAEEEDARAERLQEEISEIEIKLYGQPKTNF